MVPAVSLILKVSGPGPSFGRLDSGRCPQSTTAKLKPTDFVGLIDELQFTNVANAECLTAAYYWVRYVRACVLVLVVHKYLQFVNHGLRKEFKTG